MSRSSPAIVLGLVLSFCPLSCLLWLVTSDAFGQTTKPAAAEKPVAKGPERFAKEIDAFEAWDSKNAVPRDCILFVGSSSIRLWPTAEAFPGLPVVNRGFGGSTIADVNYFDEVVVGKYKPRVIVFYAGDNDIAGGKSPDRVFADFKVFNGYVHSQLPKARLLYLPIKPSPLRWKLWPKAEDVNARVKKLAEESDQLDYVDTATPLLGDDGEPNANYYRPDRLHMNEDGYKVWNKILAPILQDAAN